MEAGVHGHATTVVDAAAKSLDSKLKQAGEAIGDASSAMGLISDAPTKLAANGTQGFGGLEKAVSNLQSQVGSRGRCLQQRGTQFLSAYACLSEA